MWPRLQCWHLRTFQRDASSSLPSLLHFFTGCRLMQSLVLWIFALVGSITSTQVMAFTLFPLAGPNPVPYEQKILRRNKALNRQRAASTTNNSILLPNRPFEEGWSGTFGEENPIYWSSRHLIAAARMSFNLNRRPRHQRYTLIP